MRPRELWLALRRENVPAIAAVALALLLAGAALVALAENGPRTNIHSFGDAIWFAASTITSVGYGDYTPTTAGGRVVGAMLMLGGVTVFSVLTATVASVLVTKRIKEERGLETLTLKDHLLVCGWNPYAERVLDAVFGVRGSADVVLVNELPEESVAEVVARMAGRPLRYVRGDAASEATLERAGVRRARAAIVLADATHGPVASDDRTTLVTLALKSQKPDLRVTVEALELKSETHLRRAGADDVVVSGEFNGFLLSSAAVEPGIAQVVRPLLSVSGSELRRVSVPPDLVGRTFGELAGALRARDGFLAIAVVSENRGLTLDQLLSDDTSLIDRFIKDQFSEAGREFLRFEGEGTRALVNPPDTYQIGANDAVIGIPRQP